MADRDPPKSPSKSADPDPAPESAKRPRRRRRRLRWTLLLVAVLLLGLVALGPMIASTGPARRLALASANGELAGTVRVADWSLSWTGPQRVRGLSVLDETGKEALAVSDATVPVGLLSLLTGGRDLGEVRIESLSADVAIGPDGTTNLERAFASADASQRSRRSKKKKESRESAPPPWRGRLTIAQLAGRVEADPAAAARLGLPVEPINLSGSLAVAFPDGLAEAIEHELSIKLKLKLPGDGGDGELSSKGKARLFRNGRFDPRSVQAEEELSFDLPAALAGPALAAAGVAGVRIEGDNVSGSLTLRADTLDDVSGHGTLRSGGFSAEVPATGDAIVAMDPEVEVSIHPSLQGDAGEPSGAGSPPGTAPRLAGGVTLRAGRLAWTGPRFPETLIGSGQVDLRFVHGLDQPITQAFSFSVGSSDSAGTVRGGGTVTLAWSEAGRPILSRTRLDQSFTIRDAPVALLGLLGSADSLPAELRAGRLNGRARVNAPDGLGGRPITHLLDLTVTTADGASRIHSEGTTTLPWGQDDRPIFRQLVGQVKATVERLPLTLLNVWSKPGAPPPVRWQGGELNGSLAASARSLEAGDVDATFTVDQARGEVTASGDRLDVPRAKLDLAGELADGWIKVRRLEQETVVNNASGSGPAQATSLSGTGELPASLLGLSAGPAEEAAPPAGQLTFTLNGQADLAVLAAHLPRLAERELKLRPGVTIDRGRVAFKDLRVSGDREMTAVHGRLAVERIVGRLDGRAVAVEPVTVAFNAVRDGETWQLPAPGVTLEADWGGLRAVGGPDGQVRVETTRPIRLGRLNEQLAQFIDLGYSLDGEVQFEASAARKADGQTTVAVLARGANVKIASPPDAKGKAAEPFTFRTLAGEVRAAIDPAGHVVRFEKIAAADGAGALAVNASGQLSGLDSQADRRLTLDGDWRTDGAALAALLGPRWPQDLAVALPAAPEKFSLDLPLARWQTVGRFETRLPWRSINYRGLAVGTPAAPMQLVLAGGVLTASRTRAPANDGALAVLARVTLNEPAAEAAGHAAQGGSNAGRDSGPWLLPAAGEMPLKLLDGVTINERMSRIMLARTHPLLVGSTGLGGRMTMELTRVELPLDGERIKRAGQIDGSFSIEQFRARGPLMDQLVRLAGADPNQPITLRQPIEFRDGRFFIRDSRMTLGQVAFAFDGWIGLDDRMKLSVTFKITADLLARYGGGRDLVRYLGDTPITVPLKGSPAKPDLDFTEVGRLMPKLIAQSTARYLLDRQLKAGPRPAPAPPGQPPPATQPAPRRPEDEALDRVLDVGLDALDAWLRGQKKKER